MANTTFVNYQTVIDSTWFQDVNNFIYLGTVPSSATWLPTPNAVLITNASGKVIPLTTVASSILTTSAGGVPQWDSGIPVATTTTLTINGTTNQITVTGGTQDLSANRTWTVALSAGYVGQASITTVGTITSGVWNGTILTGTYGGTGVNNGASTITVGGNVTFSGAFTFTGTLTATTAVTFPTSGTLVNTAVTTLSSLVSVGTITTGVWTGTNIALANGGTNANLTASNGGIFYSTASAGAILAGTATANKMLLSGSSTAPTWSTSTIPTSAGATSGCVLMSNGTNYVMSTPAYPNSAPSNGQIPIGNGTNFVASTITAGAGITVTNGSGTITLAVSGGSGVNRVISQIFTASGTYTPSTGMLYCYVKGVGGGGAGGGAGTSGSTAGAGGGGGSGAYGEVVLTAAQIGASKAVTIGAGGTAGTAGNNPGNNGSATSLGTLFSVGGGTGGSGTAGTAVTNFTAGGAGGTGTTGDILIPGMKGKNGTYFNGLVSIGGEGGSSVLGAGGVTSEFLLAGGGNAGLAGSNYGSGGSGGAGGTSATVAGGAGTAGILYIIEFTS